MLDRGNNSVVEVSTDGSFDVSEANKTWEALKAEGNELFKRKEYRDALVWYSDALGRAPASEAYLLHGNRATCHYQLKQYREALEEVNMALKLVPNWEKGISRKRCILQAIAKQKTEFQVPLGSVYDDKAHVIPDTSETKQSQLLWRRLKSGLDSANQDCLDGVFARLNNEAEFQKLMYPGMSLEEVQKQKLPRSLKQLLEDPWYEAEMVDLMPKVEAKASLVLENVKRKGAEVGDFMDAATEATLRPQVFREAFGREVIAMLHRVNVKKHALLSKDASRIADPFAECATWDSLNNNTLANLLGNSAFGIQDDFLGDEYIPLLLSDVARMWKQNQLMDVGGAHIRFLDVPSPNSSALSDSYPALMELVEKLHGLPNEINRKRETQLCTPLGCSTSLVCLQPGESQPMRLDCGTDATTDNGYKLTCVYCIGSSPATPDKLNGGEIRLRSYPPTDDNNDEVLVEPLVDRLILFQSQRVLNGIAPVDAAKSPMFYVIFRIHGLRL